MSTVLYTCDQGCRGFFAPGGTRLKCHKHSLQFLQRETYEGTSFAFKDEKGKVHVPNPDEVAFQRGDRDYLIERYRQLYGKGPDGRFSNETILKQIQEIAPQPALDTEGDLEEIT